MKRLLGILMVLVVALLLTAPALAEEEMELHVYLVGDDNSEVEMEDGVQYTMNVGDKIHVQVQSEYTEGVKISYYWNTPNIHTFGLGELEATITIPDYAEPESVNLLQVQAIINDYTHNVHEVIGKYVFTITIPEDVAQSSLLYNGTLVSTSETVDLPAGAALYLEAESEHGISQMACRWDDESLILFPENETRGKLFVPNYADGSVHELKTQVKVSDGTRSVPKVYNIRVVDPKFPRLYVYTETEVEGDEVVPTTSDGFPLLQDEHVYHMHVGDEVKVRLEYPYAEGVEIAYYWNGGTLDDIHKFPVGEREAVILIPEAEVGSHNRLQVQAIVNDYTHDYLKRLEQFCYEIVIVE